MRFCSNCGMQLEDGVRFCSNCGVAANDENPQKQQPFYQQSNYQQSPYQQQVQAKPDVPSTGLKVLSFFFPLVGLILFILNQKDQPVSAKAYGKMALISFIIGIVFNILYFVFIGVLVGTGTFATINASALLFVAL